MLSARNLSQDEFQSIIWKEEIEIKYTNLINLVVDAYNFQKKQHYLSLATVL